MLGVSEHGIPRLKKMQKERKCLLSIVAGFPFAKQLCAPTRTNISEEEQRATTCMSAQVWEKNRTRSYQARCSQPTTPLLGWSLSYYDTRHKAIALQTFWTRGFKIKNNSVLSNSWWSCCAHMARRFARNVWEKQSRRLFGQLVGKLVIRIRLGKQTAAEIDTQVIHVFRSYIQSFKVNKKSIFGHVHWCTSFQRK